MTTTTIPNEEAEARWCEVCEEADGEPLTVPIPAWPFRTCRGCTDGFDDLVADDPEAAALTIDLAAIRRFGATAFDLSTQPGATPAFR